MLDSLFYTGTDSFITISNFVIALASAFALGFINSITYMKTGKNKMPTQSFSITLIVLPAVVTIIILLVGNNVARAFSLAGAFAIIRFRSAPGDPKDITYVLFSMAIGLACGMGFIVYAGISAAALCGVIAILELTGYGQVKATVKQLKITVPEDLDYKAAFGDIMGRYTLYHSLVRIRTTELGSLYQLTYEITLKGGINEKEFIDELRCRNGNLDIVLLLSVTERETVGL